MGIVSKNEALDQAEAAKLDLVEIAPNASPPVCKIIDYGKFRYDQTKREKESKKAQIQTRVKEVKVKPNIDEHDFQTKLRFAKKFIEQGHKVKVTCMLRGREFAHPERAVSVVERLCEAVDDLATPEAPVKRFGRSFTTVLAPGSKKKAGEGRLASEG